MRYSCERRFKRCPSSAEVVQTSTQKLDPNSQSTMQLYDTELDGRESETRLGELEVYEMTRDQHERRP